MTHHEFLTVMHISTRNQNHSYPKWTRHERYRMRVLRSCTDLMIRMRKNSTKEEGNGRL